MGGTPSFKAHSFQVRWPQVLRYCIVYILHINIERVADFTTQSSYKFKFYTLAANLQKTIEVLSPGNFEKEKNRLLLY